MFAHFTVDDVQAHQPHRAECSAVFITPMPHVPYSPDLAPSDFSVFPRMKKVPKGKHFADVEEGKQKTAEALKGIKIHEFKKCFGQWRKHLHRCIASNGECFEGD